MSGTTHRNGPLVLYVDDERGNRIVFEQSLNSEFNLRTASSAADALDVLDQHEVAAVVSDMRMPSMSGEELLRIVKERHPEVIRMVVTAYADVEPILRAINEGLVARYIITPGSARSWSRCCAGRSKLGRSAAIRHSCIAARSRPSGWPRWAASPACWCTT